MSDQRGRTSDTDPDGIERSLGSLFVALAGGDPTCGATTERDGMTLVCAGITCAMFPGEHKAFGIEPGWSTAQPEGDAS